MAPGIGMKSTRTEARELHLRLGYRPERIASMLGITEEEAAEAIYGKARKANRKRGAGISPASPEQRAKVKDRACIICRRFAGHCHPAHLIDRSIGGDDDPRAVVPLCAADHRAYDEQGFDLLPYLEPNYREELAYAVECVGLLNALNRITNQRYEPSITEDPV